MAYVDGGGGMQLMALHIRWLSTMGAQKKLLVMYLVSSFPYYKLCLFKFN